MRLGRQGGGHQQGDGKRYSFDDGRNHGQLFLLNCKNDQARLRIAAQSSSRRTRLVEAGYLMSFSAGRIGRRENSPPQFGQAPPNAPFAQSVQNVHSNVQIMASREAGGRSLPQHSQLGRSSSM